MAKAPSKPTTKSLAKGKTPVKVKAKATPKKAISKAAPIQAAAKTVATAARKKATVKKAVAVKASAAPQKSTPVKKPAASTKMGLQAKLDDVTKRLNTANTQTQKNITALESDFSALAKQMGRTKAGQTRLTRRVTELSKTLTHDFETMQSDIRKELAGALQNPTLINLQGALARADERLSESETAQGTAIARINRHIADIATIVEDRLSEESQAREAAMAEMKQVMESRHAVLEKKQATQTQSEQLRFSNLQSESADAIRSLGDKLVDVAEEMGRRRDTLGAKIREELSESTLSSNADFEQFRRVVERRLEALESETRGFDTHIDRAIAPLASRIEGLEYGLTQSAETPQQDYAPSLQALPPVGSIAASALSAPVNQPEIAEPPVAAPYQAQDDAFNPMPAPVQPAAPQTQVSAQAPLELTEPANATAVPYDPAAYQNPAYGHDSQLQAHAPTAQAPELQDPYASTAYAQNPYGGAQASPQDFNLVPPYNEPPYQAPQNYAAQQPPFPMANELPVHESDLPYADPAYAEGNYGNPVQAAEFGDDSMNAARPGAFDNLKKIGRKTRSTIAANDGGLGGSPLVTPRNLKIGALVAALGLASFVGVQTLKSGSAPTNLAVNAPEFSVANNSALDESRPTLGGPVNQQILGANGAVPPAIIQETIGQYADNRTVALTEGGETALNTAAKAGNPIAQLQLGLSQIENGKLDSGVELIRASANQEQPAALYRLAKLYETGQGVGQDSKTARQLTERAARGGNRIAMHDLALYFAEPDGRGGVEMDMPTAARWFEKAAERGVVDSQYNLGILFESGQGLPQDMESALVWYSIAGTQGDQMAASRVGVLRKTLSEDQIQRADKRIAGFAPSRIDEEANGIFNNVPWAAPAQVASNGGDKTNIIQTQTLLNNLGYAVGTADGAIGPKTKNAILNFQRNNGMNETGVVNAELIDRLENAAGA